MKIVMLGAPGAGKGTQAIMISEYMNIPHISTGDIFRSNIKGNTELGKKAKSYMDKGELVPDELTIDMLYQRITEPDCQNGFVLDGFPRTIKQAEALTKSLEENNTKIDLALDIDVPDDVIVERMSGRRACPRCGNTYHIVYAPSKTENKCDRCGEDLIIRNDDKPETVLERLRVYHEKTQPLIDYYRNFGVLKSVSGTRKPNEIFKSIQEFISL